MQLRFMVIPLLPLLMIACGHKTESSVTSQPPEQVHPGRFQVLQLGSMRRDVYLIDTHSGRMWARVCMVSSKGSGPDCAFDAWRHEAIEGINYTQQELNEMAKLIRGQ